MSIFVDTFLKNNLLYVNFICNFVHVNKLLLNMEPEVIAEQLADTNGKAKQIQSTYPSETISASIGLVKAVVTAKGEINPISKKDYSIILEKAESTLTMKLSTCVQYGLLKLSFGKGYLPGAHYHKYVYEDQLGAQLLIFSTPPLYRKLIDDLNGKVLPNEKDFANHLKNNYGLNPNSSEKAASVFLENAKSLNLIDANNRLKFIIKDTPPAPENNNVVDKPAEAAGNVDQPPSPGLFKLPIQLPGDDHRFAYFEYPKTLTKRDFKVIAKALTFVASSLISDSEDEDYELIIKVDEKKGQ